MLCKLLLDKISLLLPIELTMDISKYAFKKLYNHNIHNRNWPMVHGYLKILQLYENYEYKIKFVKTLISNKHNKYGNVMDIHIPGVHMDRNGVLCKDILNLCKSSGLEVETRKEGIKEGLSNLSRAFLMNFDTSLNYTSHYDKIMDNSHNRQILTGDIDISLNTINKSFTLA